MGYINDQEWNRYNTYINNLSEVTLKDFQFKINNKILVTKTFLHQIRKVEDNLCSYCKREPETILHLFVECDKVKEFWQSLRIWLMQNVNISINLDKKGILFSYQGKCILKNYIMVVAKHYIYKNKFSAKQLNINSFISMLKVNSNVKGILFVCFVALRPKSTAMVIAGRSVHLTTLFPGQA